VPYYITTPLFYVNDLPHIGSAYPTIVADFLAEHMRQRGQDVAFLTGTDEHGQKIEKAAETNNKSPQEHCDYIAEEFKKLWQILDIKNDYFIRTSENKHKKFVTEFFEKVRSNGDIYKGEYQGLYCVSCEDFWLEKDLEENDKQEKICPTHKKPVENYSQQNYFFALSKYQEKLEKYIEANPDIICPDYRRNEVLGWLKEGLRDFPISRCNLKWGIPIPGDTEGQVIYVWFDALLGYLSGLDEKRNKYFADNSVVHIIGKDILRFHAVYWPAMLMSAGMPLPKKVFGHGFLTKDGMKMGKTLGNIIDPIALTERFGAEALKFYFLREIVFGRDGDYTDASFITRLNTDLANNLGNLLNRSLKLINKYCDNTIPANEIDPRMQEALKNLQSNFLKNIDEINPHSAFEELFKTLDLANMIINEIEPWRALKKEDLSPEDKDKALSSLTTAVKACYQAAFYLAAAMPKLSKKIFDNLNLEADFAFKNINKNLSGLKISENPEGIFQRIELANAV
jgi:methionyl-tRNA synthetase